MSETGEHRCSCGLLCKGKEVRQADLAVIELTKKVTDSAVPHYCGGERSSSIEPQINLGLWLDLKTALNRLKELRGEK